VLISNLNRQQMLPDVLNRCATTFWTGWKVIMVDNCSSDDSVPLLKRRSHDFPNGLVLKKSKRPRLTAAITGCARSRWLNFYLSQ